jgi:hypothetical protein
MIGRVSGRLGAMNSEPGTAGYGPDDMGDDEQESEVSEWEQYIEDPPEGELPVAEDNDDDAEQAVDWAERHPRQVAQPEEDDTPAEESAIHEIPGT